MAADAGLLAELAARTFYETFAKDNTPENMAEHLKSSYSPEIQLAELTTPGHLFLIAEEADTPIGFAHLILGSTEEAVSGAKPLEVRRIYVAQNQIGKGIGKALMQATIHEASQRNCDCIWLGVWEKNPRAMAFYQQWGFVTVGAHIFDVGGDPQQDYLMELKLTAI
jgi:GNAT superfamily N-acetyltransferase